MPACHGDNALKPKKKGTIKVEVKSHESIFEDSVRTSKKTEQFTIKRSLG
jgi:hypothetical protein